MSISLVLFSFLALACYADIYEDLARSTGGSANRMTKEQFMKNVEDGRNRYQYMANAVPLLIEDVNLSSGSAKIFTFTIDAEVFGGLVVEVKGPKPGTLKLSSPDGHDIVTSKESGPVTLPVEMSRPDHRIVIVPHPQKGLWKLALNDVKGALTVRLQSSLKIQKLQFVEMAGRSGHQGLFPIEGQPMRGSLALLEIDLNKKRPKEVEIIDAHGSILSSEKKVKLRENDSYFIDVRIPDVPFRVLVRGDKFQRISSQVFTPK